MPKLVGFGKGLKVDSYLTCALGRGDNGLMRIRCHILGFLAALVFAWGVQAQIKLRVYIPDVANPEELNLKIPMTSNGTNFDLFFDLPKNEGTTISDAAKTYVPVLGTSLTSEASIFSLNGSSKADDLPQVSAGVPPDAVLTFEKEITVTSGDDELFLYAAVANEPDNDDWRVIGQNTNPVPASANEFRHKVAINLATFCEQSEIADCDELVGSDDSIMAELYFFLSESSNLSVNTKIDPNNSLYNHGVYYEVHLSSNLNDSTIVDILDVKRGDEGLSLQYRSNQTIDEFDRVLVAQYKDPGVTTIGDITPNQFLGEYSNILLFGDSDSDTFPALTEGSIFVEPLKNGEEAFLSVAFMDKFQFVTPLSDPESETPLEIETLLQEQSCFFFTAGFGQEHWVIDELKKFRDQVLKSSPLGNVLVDVYYKFAPQYAHIILDHSWLQYLVRGIAYTLVFMIQAYVALFIGGILLLALGLWLLFKRKALFNFSTRT